MATRGAQDGVGTVDVQLTYRYEDADHPISGCCTAPNPDRERTITRTTLLTVSVRPVARLGLSVTLPHRNIEAPKTPGGDEDKQIFRHYEGMGDVLLMADFDLLGPRSDERSRRNQLALLAGLRLPTGEANPNHVWKTADGGTMETRDAVLQPGHGTLDPLIGLRYVRRVGKGRSTVHVAMVHRFADSRNDYGYRFGDETQLSVGGRVPLSKRVALELSAEGLHLSRDVDHERDGVREGTGGDWLRLGARVEIALGKGFRVGFGGLVPVYRHSNGSVLDSDIALGASIGKTFQPRAARSAPPPRSRAVEVASRGEEKSLGDLAVSGRFTLVQFHADWCRACRAGEGWLQDFMARKPTVAVRRVDVTDGGPIMEQHEVVATPTFLLFDPSGELVLRTSSDLPAIEEKLRRVGGR